MAGLVPGVAVIALGAGDPAFADAAPSWHVFSGVDATRHSAFSHGGFVWSPQRDLHAPGWRLRGLVSGGAFRYEAQGVGVTGRALAAELTPGYAWMWGARGLTLYLGAAVHDHATSPHDPGKPRQGTRFGAKTLVEAWTRISDHVLLDASAGYATATRSYAARLAVAVSVADLVLEPEIAAFGEPGYDQFRLGLHAELYRTPQLRLLVGGGWSFDREGNGAYAGLRVKSWR